MKLLVFCPHYPPYIGGLETHAAEFNTYMSLGDEVDEIVVFTSRLPVDTPAQETSGKVTIIRFPAFDIIPNYPLPRFWLPLFWRQWRHIQGLPVDLVVSRTRFSFTSLMALVLAKLGRKPWVHIEHGSDYVQLASPLFSFCAYVYDRTIGWAIFRFSTQTIAISEAVRDFVLKFDTRSVPVIYRGVETELIESIKPDPDVRRQYHGKTLVIYVGRLIDGKGVADLLRALKQSNNTTVVGLIVGDGPQRANLESLTHSLGLNDQVHFYGQQPLPRAMALVKAADIFVNPSYTEGLPSSVIEAALCKKCIIATDVGGTREIIENHDSGFLIPPRDVPALAQALETARNDQALRRKMGNRAATAAKARFSWPRSCDTYKGIFHKILHRHDTNS